MNHGTGPSRFGWTASRTGILRLVYSVTAVCSCILLTACNAPTHSVAQSQAEQRWKHVRARIKFQLAEQQYGSGLFEEAAHTATESLALDPKQADALVVLARADLELARVGSAQQALDAARLAGLESPDLIYTQGVIFEQRGQIEEALQRYAEAQSLDDSNVDYLVATAECMVAMGRTAEALSLLDEYMHRLDDNGTVAVLAAHVAALLGDTNGAVGRLSEAVVPPASRDAVAQERGLLLARLDRCEEALAVLQPLLSDRALGNRSARTDLLSRGLQPARTADLPSRGLSWRAGTRTAGGTMLRALAACYLTLDNPVAAVRTLAEYGRHHPDDTVAQLILAKAGVATDDMLTALRAIDLLEQREPNHPEVKLVRAVIQWRRGDLDGAAAHLEEVLADNPRDVEAHCLMAEILRTQRQPQAARIHFERALRIRPDSTWAATALR